LITHGFSALGLSAPEILEREFIVYDALYAECAGVSGRELNSIMFSRLAVR